MNLRELKERIESYPMDYMPFELSEPFSWRGVYAEVAFELSTQLTAKSVNLAQIQKAISEPYYGWKGGEFEYTLSTDVHFETDYGSWSDGRYLTNFLVSNHNDAITHIFKD